MKWREVPTLGKRLGRGVVVSGIYGYHFGYFSLREWKYEKIGLRLLLSGPERFMELANEIE